MTLRNLFLLVLVNNILHYINEKVVIIVFLIVFFYILKIAQTLLENEYTSKVDQLSTEVENYLLSLFDILRYYKNFFRRLSDFKFDFYYSYLKLKKSVSVKLFPLKITTPLVSLASASYLKNHVLS